MKINSWIVCLLAIWLSCMHADEKIYHMIYAEKQPAPFNENEQNRNNRDLLYCIKTDNNLYALDVTDNKKDYWHHEIHQIKLFTSKTQTAKNITAIINDGSRQGIESDNLEEVNGRLMMIGQPIVYLGTWIMPAVVRRKYFGFLQSTDLCVVLQKTVENYGEGYDNYRAVKYDSTKYIVYTIAEGHRTPANFVDIIKIENNKWTLRSSSKWPTIKTVDLDNPKNNPPKKDAYFLDSYQQDNLYFDLQAKVSKPFFNKKQVKSLTCNVKKGPENAIQPITLNLKNTYVTFWPKITLNPKFVFEEITEDIRVVLESIFLDKKLQDKNVKYKIYVNKKNHIFWVPINQVNGFIVHKRDNIDKPYIPFVDKNNMATASAYDFKNERLFFAKYNINSESISIEGQYVKK